ncbi:MAG: hypothetical protein V1907_00515 [Candidatus Kerfeldbacteria bacterium]
MKNMRDDVPPSVASRSIPLKVMRNMEIVMNEIYTAAKLIAFVAACFHIGNASMVVGWKDDKWIAICVGTLSVIASAPIAFYAVFHFARAIISLTIFAK